MTGGEAMEKKLMLAPSMGCCDLYDFGHQVKFIDEHADFLHIDIKDGNYVKTFGVGPDFMTVLKKVVKPMDAHLMVKHPQDYIEACRKLGARFISLRTQIALKVMLLGRSTRLSLWDAKPDCHEPGVLLEAIRILPSPFCRK